MSSYISQEKIGFPGMFGELQRIGLQGNYKGLVYKGLYLPSKPGFLSFVNSILVVLSQSKKTLTR
jgi:hypothetical protein